MTAIRWLLLCQRKYLLHLNNKYQPLKLALILTQLLKLHFNPLKAKLIPHQLKKDLQSKESHLMRKLQCMKRQKSQWTFVAVVNYKTEPTAWFSTLRQPILDQNKLIIAMAMVV